MSSKVGYNDNLGADEQISIEEKIASRISEMSDGSIDEEVCAEIGREALYAVIEALRPDLLVSAPLQDITEDDKPRATKALADMLWDHLPKDREHNDRRQTCIGTKTKVGLRRSIESLLDDKFMAKQAPLNHKP